MGIINWIKDRIKENSTIGGLATIAGAVGLSVNPAIQAALINVYQAAAVAVPQFAILVGSVVGAYHVLKQDKPVVTVDNATKVAVTTKKVGK